MISLYRKIRWFFKFYNDISFEKKLAPTSATIVEGNIPGKITYAADGLVTTNNCDFIREERFARAYKAAADTKPWEGFTLQWRVYVVCWFANHVKNLEGDFVECGVNTGAYSRAIIEYVDFNKLGKKFYLLDTFEGLAEELVSEEEKQSGIAKYFGTYTNVFEQVKETFRGFNVEIIKGRVPDSLVQCDAKKIAYLSIDMNVAAPEIAAANFFWDKVVPGGVIILDDYGFPEHINQKIAFDEFAKQKNVDILSLPTGQGIIFKP